MLLSNFLNLLGQSSDNVPSTGSLIKTDTANVVVPVKYIRMANVKMIERLYLIEVNKQKDSIIIYKNQLIDYQKNNIDELHNALYYNEKVNKDLDMVLSKQKRKTKILTYSFAGIIAGLFVGVMIK